MFGSSGGRRLGAVLIAALAPLGVQAVAQADDEPAGKEVVVLGDSFTSNYLQFKGDDDTEPCKRGDDSWPNQLSRLAGIAGTQQFDDQSCVGASIDSKGTYTMTVQTLAAAKAGDFGPSTKLIALQFGLNDYWTPDDVNPWHGELFPCVLNLPGGCPDEAVPTAGEQAITGAAFAARAQKVITYLRYYAPNAKIVLVGYPIVWPAGGSDTCVNVLGVGPIVNPHAQVLVSRLDAMDAAQREAARLLGIDFLDSRALTAGHDLCSPQPWIDGIADPDALGALPLHPSREGDAVVAAALADKLAN
ncbi:SGNH/GDSL hydrolase family protein [Nocardia stercoris]|uniref:SGNH/GDSL hydrolase family protein n=1 Tax=Nocardia stercoris TaxID=2483361 RepID=A0A3M2LKP2_9NOCA|nr:SGNH/GDSL hydrolase family protein [Nocardia stercoris]RMI35358.1 SGNH/GDSL hydrolase family protein [Nocardia stercoris]